MWLDQGASSQANEIIKAKLNKCLYYIDDYEKKHQIIDQDQLTEFRTVINSLITELDMTGSNNESIFKDLMLMTQINAKGSGPFNRLCQTLRNVLIKQDIEREYLASPTIITATSPVWHPVNKICFKGDIESPESVFEQGFNAHDMPDISFTSRFRTATLFPLDEKIESTWVYIFYAKKAYSAHQDHLNNLVKQGLNNDAGLLLAEDLRTDNIDSSAIIGAAKISRFADDVLSNKYSSFFKKDLNRETEQFMVHFLEKRGNYKILEYLKNPHCTLSAETKALAEWYIRKERLDTKVYPESAVAHKETVEVSKESPLPSKPKL